MHFTDVTEVQSSFSLMGWTKEWMLGLSADLQKVEPGTQELKIHIHSNSTFEDIEGGGVKL